MLDVLVAVMVGAPGTGGAAVSIVSEKPAVLSDSALPNSCCVAASVCVPERVGPGVWVGGGVVRWSKSSVVVAASFWVPVPVSTEKSRPVALLIGRVPGTSSGAASDPFGVARLAFEDSPTGGGSFYLPNTY